MWSSDRFFPLTGNRVVVDPTIGAIVRGLALPPKDK
jgi:hypothetical protein